MKNVFYLTLALLFTFQSALCQVYEESVRFEKGKVFVRVFDLDGKKISKGKIVAISETSLQLIRDERSDVIPVSNIGSIKTKHSGGNNVLIGATIGAIPMAVFGYASADPDAEILATNYTAGEGALQGVLLGGTLGAGIGGITTLFKNSKSYTINGDAEKWKIFKESIIKDYK